jgi:translation initiation factor 1
VWSQAAVAAGRRIAHDGNMASRANERLVYSTGEGSTCPRCGWPAASCRCSSRVGEEPVPVRVVAKLRVEKAGRGGKTVTVVYDLPRNAAFLKGLCQELKRACGSGGAVRDGAVEIQGDLRDRVRDVLLEKGLGVKA